MLRTAQLLPQRALDTGLRPGPFPTRAASLLPGLLTATRTGLTPASDDEHEPTDHPGPDSHRQATTSTNQQITPSRGTSSSTGRTNDPGQVCRRVTVLNTGMCRVQILVAAPRITSTLLTAGLRKTLPRRGAARQSPLGGSPHSSYTSNQLEGCVLPARTPAPVPGVVGVSGRDRRQH